MFLIILLIFLNVFFFSEISISQLFFYDYYFLVITFAHLVHINPNTNYCEFIKNPLCVLFLHYSQSISYILYVGSYLILGLKCYYFIFLLYLVIDNTSNSLKSF